jgi:hypothetical protein
MGPSERREDWYISGGYALHRMLVSRYGRQTTYANLIPILIWAGMMAMLRGERSLALKRYVASVWLRPTRIETWIRLCTILLPVEITAHIERKRRLRIYGPTDLIVARATDARNR